jgi:Transposase domain (DUF772).
MTKIQKISEIQPSICFTEFDLYRQYEKSFHSSELGQLRLSLPLELIAQSIGLRSKTLGRESYFSATGKLALMVLKSYSGLSDRCLVEQLNANIHYQFFCGVRISPSNPLTNFKIVSEIRCEIGRLLDIDKVQQVLASYWKPYLNDTHVLMTDATCYESHMRYPTEVKLLWESVDWVYKELRFITRSIKGRMPRTKYDKQRLLYRIYSKKRKRRISETRVRKRSLLHLLGKLLPIIEQTLKDNRSQVQMPGIFHKRLSIIKKVYSQQIKLFNGEKVTGAIVSIDKDYIRAIVRGKESKSVEFGAKVNTIQIGGINFIEHLSFDAFHEGIRLPQCIAKHQKLFRKRVTHLAGDRLYATNDNRSHCSSRNITTSFVRKGRAGKDEELRQQVRNILNKERSTRLEGSFGTEKQHYSLSKIKARTKLTETLWIFFGIHTANAVRMIDKMQKVEIKNTA